MVGDVVCVLILCVSSSCVLILCPHLLRGTDFFPKLLLGYSFAVFCNQLAPKVHQNVCDKSS